MKLGKCHSMSSAVLVVPTGYKPLFSGFKVYFIVIELDLIVTFILSH